MPAGATSPDPFQILEIPGSLHEFSQQEKLGCPAGRDHFAGIKERAAVQGADVTQDELKQQVARAALEYVIEDAVIGVGSGSTVNLFIDALAAMKGRIEGAVAASEASAARLNS